MKFLMKRLMMLFAAFFVSYSLVKGAEAGAPAPEPLSNQESAEFRTFTQAKNREILEAYAVVRQERAALRTGAQTWPAITDNIHFNGAGFVQKGQIIYDLIASLDVTKPSELKLLKHLCSYYNVLFLTVLRKVLAESPDRFYELNGRYHALLTHLFSIPDSRDVDAMRSKYGLMQEIALFMVSSLILRANHAVNQAFPVKERTKAATEMFIHQLFHEQEALADGSVTIGWYQFAVFKGAISEATFPRDRMIEIFQPLVNVFNQRSFVGQVADFAWRAAPYVGALALAAAYWYFRAPEAPAPAAGGAAVPVPPAGLAAGGAGVAPAAVHVPAPDFPPHQPVPVAGGAAAAPVPPVAPAAELLPAPDFAPEAWLITNPGGYMAETATWLVRDALPVGMHNAGVLVRRELAHPEFQQRVGEVAEVGGEALIRGALAATTAPEARVAMAAAVAAGVGPVLTEVRTELRTAVRGVRSDMRRATRVFGGEAGRLNTNLRHFTRVVDRRAAQIDRRVAQFNTNVAAVVPYLASLSEFNETLDQIARHAEHPLALGHTPLVPGYVSLTDRREAAAAARIAATEAEPLSGAHSAPRRRRVVVTTAAAATAAPAASASSGRTHGDASLAAQHVPADIDATTAVPQAAVAVAAAVSASGRSLLAPGAAGDLSPAQRLERVLVAPAEAEEPTSLPWYSWLNPLTYIGAAVSFE